MLVIVVGVESEKLTEARTVEGREDDESWRQPWDNPVTSGSPAGQVTWRFKVGVGLQWLQWFCARWVAASFGDARVKLRRNN